MAGNISDLPKFYLFSSCPAQLSCCVGALGAVRFGVERAEGRALLQCPHASIHAPQLSAGQHLEAICTLHLFEFQDF